MDPSGIVRFTITPREEEQNAANNREDTYLLLEPTSRSQDIFALSGDNFYEEVRNIHGEVISDPGPIPPLQAVRYTERSDEGFFDQYVRIAGHGLIATPRQLPVASQRVRDAIAAGQLPAGSDHVTFTLEGTEGFQESLASGLGSIDLGNGITLVSSEVRDAKIQIVAAIDAAAFEADSQAFFNFRDITVGFGDKTEWAGEVEFFSTELRPSNDNEESDLPLNAQFGDTQAVGSVTYGLTSRGRRVPLLDLELAPSIHAAWDDNQNTLIRPKITTETGFRLAGPRLKRSGISLGGCLQSARGFERQFNDQFHVFEIRKLRRTHLPGTQDEIVVYANFEDFRRLNTTTTQLGKVDDPDGLPDFVSRTVNGESIAVRHGGTLADLLSFTVYNLSTTPDSATEMPDLTFETLAAENDINAVYGPYSSFQSSVGATLSEAATDGRITQTASVWVDREANLFNFADDNQHLNGVIPFQYFGGILDQPFQERVVGGGFGQPRSLQRVGRIAFKDTIRSSPSAHRFRTPSLRRGLDAVFPTPSAFPSRPRDTLNG